MRKKKTNVLQGVVLFTGSIYLVAGLIFFSSPFLFGKILSVQTNDEWLNQIRLDEFLIMIYLVARGLSSLLIVAGVTLIMPLFDPLKYRLLIYFEGVFFPCMIGSFLMFTGFSYGYMTAKVAGTIFVLIFLANIIALHLTKDNAKQGIE